MLFDAVLRDAAIAAPGLELRLRFSHRIWRQFLTRPS
jgi:hypothetical protein